MELVQVKNDGLHLAPEATWQQLAHETSLQKFANGLLVEAIPNNVEGNGTAVLADALKLAQAAYQPFLTALLVFEAEIQTRFDGEARSLPLTTFLAYRQKLTHNNLTLNSVRLPPLNLDGHYLLDSTAERTVVVRLDIHPELGVAGHVRIAVSGPHRPPTRLIETEKRLTWQPLTFELIDEAIQRGDATLEPPLTDYERATLAALLRSRVG